MKEPVTKINSENGIIEELKVGQEVQIGLDKKSNVKTLSNKELDKKKSPINVLKSDSTRLNSNPIVTKKRNNSSCFYCWFRCKESSNVRCSWY